MDISGIRGEGKGSSKVESSDGHMGSAPRTKEKSHVGVGVTVNPCVGDGT